MRWWGPAGFTAPIAKMDVREGGTSLVCMRSPDGNELYNTWTYQRVVPRERLEFVMGFADADGAPTTPGDLGLPPGIPPSVPHVVTLRTAGEGRTELTVRESGYSSPTLSVLSEPTGYWDQLKRLLVTGRVLGPMVHDARIVALCAAQGVLELWSADRDFGRFASSVSVRNALVA